MPFHSYSQTAIKKLTPYEYPFDRMMVKVFAQFAAHYMLYRKSLSTGDMIKKFGWSRSEAGCFPRLRHFGIVQNIFNPIRGKPTRLYRLTEKGELFYCREGTAPDMIVTLGGEPLPEDHEAWNFHKGKMPEEKYIDELDFEVKKHADWVAERKLALGFNPTLF